MSSHCNKCDKDLSANSKQAIQCDSCDIWYCYVCIGMSKRLFDAIHAEGATPMLFVSCHTCRSSSFPMAALRKSSAIEFKEIHDKIEKLDSKLEAYKGIQEKVDQSLVMIKAQTEVSKSNYADIVKQSKETKNEILSVQREEIIKVQNAVESSAKDHIEQEERDRSIIIFKHKESKEDSKVKRAEEDLQFVNDLIDKGLNISSQEVQSCFRLGFYRDDKTRPMKVTFANKSNQVKFIEHLYRLRNAEQSFKDVSISIDRNKHEREVLKVLVAEADDKSKASNDKRYVVRGTYKPYIVEKTK